MMPRYLDSMDHFNLIVVNFAIKFLVIFWKWSFIKYYHLVLLGIYIRFYVFAIICKSIKMTMQFFSCATKKNSIVTILNGVYEKLF